MNQSDNYYVKQLINYYLETFKRMPTEEEIYLFTGVKETKNEVKSSN